MHLDPDLLSSAVTIVWFLAFLGLCLWAWSGRRQRDFAAAARLPLEEAPPAAERDRTGES